MHPGASFYVSAAAVWAGLLFSASIEAGSPAKLTPAESRGKVIYTTGRTASGKRLSYRIASGDEYLPARGVGCENCHGDDGKGREGDVLTPPITFETLANPFTFRSRSRSPYDSDAVIVRAITEGFDASDNRLNVAMPRWALSKSELQDLLAYLKRLRSE